MVNSCWGGVRYALGHCRDEGGGGSECAMVERTFVTSVVDGSGALMAQGQASVVQIGPVGVVETIPNWVVQATSGNSVPALPSDPGPPQEYDGILVSIDPNFDAVHEAHVSLSITKIGAGSNNLRFRFVSNYPGFGPVFSRWLEFSLGGFSSDDDPSLNYASVILPYAMYPGALGPPTVTVEVERVSGSGNVIEIRDGQFYTKQLFAKSESVTIMNCEVAAPPVVCPEVVAFEVFDNTDPLSPVLLGSKQAGEGAFDLGPGQFIPLLVRIELSEELDPSEWTSELSTGANPPESISYEVVGGTPFYVITYTQAFAEGGFPSVAAFLSVNDDCPPIVQPMTVTVPA